MKMNLIIDTDENTKRNNESKNGRDRSQCFITSCTVYTEQTSHFITRRIFKVYDMTREQNLIGLYE